MRVGYLISNYLPRVGGAEVCIHNLASGITKKGHEAVVMTPRSGTGDAAFSYKVVRLNFLLNKLVFSNFSIGRIYLAHILGRLQKRYQFDIWQVTIGYPLGAAAVDFFNENGIPCVLRCSGEDIQVNPEIKYGYRLNKNVDSIVRKNYGKFTALVANSDSMKKEYQLLGIPDHKINIIPNGVDCARFASISDIDRENTRKELGVERDQKLILTVGRNHPKKGFKYIPKIIRHLAEKRLNFKWLVVGKNSSGVKLLAEKEGLGTYIITSEELKPGISAEGNPEVPHNKLVRYYKASDIFAFPTLLETFGAVLLDAMAAGLPISTTNAPGVDDVIRNSDNGLKDETGDAEAMAESISRIYFDKTLSARLSENALRDASNYDWGRIVEAYLRLYGGLLDKNGKN